MNLQITAHQLSSLPSNGWAVCITRNDPQVLLFHGQRVETFAAFFAEAVWNKPFDAESMNDATLFFGTGGMLQENGIIFKTSSDASAPLFSLHRRDRFFISNSIIHLMTLSDTGPSPEYPFYTYDFIRNSRAGNRQPQGRVKHTGKGSLKIHFNTNICIGPDLVMHFFPYGRVSEPLDFSSLIDIYQSEIGHVFLNGADGRRKHPYGQTILASSGYDSLMNAVVCAKLGCNDFISVIDSCGSDPNGDSARIPLGHIGKDVHEVDRHAHLKRAEALDAEFALISTSNYPHLSGCEHLLKQRLLVGGSQGDNIWDPEMSKDFSNWQHWNKWVLPGFASLEHRLRVGYIDLNPEVMFALHAKLVSQISRSDEMQPYTLSNNYDRPIPRRIIENVGIPRGSFALRKRATAHKHFNDPLNQHPDARRSYESFRDRTISKGLRRLRSQCLYKVEQWLYQKYFKKHQQKRNDNPDRFRLVALDGKRFHVPWSQSFLFQWSVEQLKSRYAGSKQVLSSRKA